MAATPRVIITLPHTPARMRTTAFYAVFAFFACAALPAHCALRTCRCCRVPVAFPAACRHTHLYTAFCTCVFFRALLLRFFLPVTHCWYAPAARRRRNRCHYTPLRYHFAVYTYRRHTRFCILHTTAHWYHFGFTCTHIDITHTYYAPCRIRTPGSAHRHYLYHRCTPVDSFFLLPTAFLELSFTTVAHFYVSVYFSFCYAFTTRTGMNDESESIRS